MDTRKKIIDASQIPALLARNVSNGRHLVVARGWFDVLRAPHCRLLADAKVQGSDLVVIVHRESDVNPTVLNAISRAQLAAAIGVVDHVVICDGMQAERLATLWKAAAVVEIDELFSHDLINDVLERCCPRKNL